MKLNNTFNKFFSNSATTTKEWTQREFSRGVRPTEKKLKWDMFRVAHSAVQNHQQHVIHHILIPALIKT